MKQPREIDARHFTAGGTQVTNFPPDLRKQREPVVLHVTVEELALIRYGLGLGLAEAETQHNSPEQSAKITALIKRLPT